MSENENKSDGPGAVFSFTHSTSAKLEQTLCLIKPDAVERSTEILQILEREGFAILQARRVRLNAEQASQFYQDLYETEWFSDSVAHLYSSDVMALALSGPGAIEHLREICGPESAVEREKYGGCLRARFGTPGSDIKNGVHCSVTESDAFRELHFFFPELVIEPVIADTLSSFYLNENVHPVLTIGLSQLVRERPEDPVLWLADWLIANNPNKPKELSNSPCA